MDLNVSAKCSILDVWLGSEYASRSKKTSEILWAIQFQLSLTFSENMVQLTTSMKIV